MSGNDDGAVVKHYDAVASAYGTHYERDNLHDTSRVYPANYFRLQLLLQSFREKGISRVVEVGVGEGTPLVTLARQGIDVWGFDISKEMVKQAKATLSAGGLDPEHIAWGDVRDSASYASITANGPFDGVIAMGVMPHVEDEAAAIDNLSALLRPGGSVFIEFRNLLFSLFTFNRYTLDFVVNDLLRDVSDDVKQVVAEDLGPRLRLDQPPQRTTLGAGAPGYDATLSKFHNPFEIVELFGRHGFEQIRLLWYHYHPAMPFLASHFPERFREEAIALEGEASNWRGYFLCSAFVVEAVKAGARQ